MSIYSFLFTEHQIYMFESYFCSHFQNEMFVRETIWNIGGRFWFWCAKSISVSQTHVVCEWMKFFLVHVRVPGGMWAFFRTSRSFYKKAPMAKFFNSGFLYFSLLFLCLHYVSHLIFIMLLLSLFFVFVVVPNQEYKMEIDRWQRKRKKRTFTMTHKCVNE